MITPIQWILMGGSLGMIIGAIVALAWVNEKLIAYYQDSENHRHAALMLSRKLAQVRKENEELNEQMDALLSHFDGQDDADWWKETLK